MKKWFYLTILILIGWFVLLRPENFLLSKKTNATIGLEEDLKLEAQLPEKIIRGRNWQDIKNFSMNPKEFVNLKNSKDIFQECNESIIALNSCLKKDFCGMQAKNEDDSYFDEEKTPAHILLARIMEVMREALMVNSSLRSNVNWVLVRELTESTNDKIPVLAFGLIKDFEKENPDLEELLKITTLYKGRAKASSLLELANLFKDKDKKSFIEAIENAFVNDDPHTVISIVEQLGEMKLTLNELLDLSLALCHYNEDELNISNWIMLKYIMKKQKIDLEEICL